MKIITSDEYELLKEHVWREQQSPRTVMMRERWSAADAKRVRGWLLHCNPSVARRPSPRWYLEVPMFRSFHDAKFG